MQKRVDDDPFWKDISFERNWGTIGLGINVSQFVAKPLKEPTNH